MCLFKYGLSIEHDCIDARHLLKKHQHDPDHERLVDTRILEVRQLEARTLRENRKTKQSMRRFIVWDCRLNCLTFWSKQSRYLLQHFQQWWHYNKEEGSVLCSFVICWFLDGCFLQLLCLSVSSFSVWLQTIYLLATNSQANQSQTHLLITGILDACTLPFDGGVWTSQEA